MKRKQFNTSNVKRNTAYVGETIEDKVRRITNNKEPISDGAPQIYSERKDGVLPDYDIRTDRWEKAVEATDKISKSHKAKRDERHNKKTEGGKDDSKGDPKDSKVDNAGNPGGEGSTGTGETK